MIRLTVETRKRCEFIDITDQVVRAVETSGVRDGMVVIYCPHTTAGITINENADPSVMRDMERKLSRVFEKDDSDYRHGEGNSDSHIKSSLVGASETVILEEGRLALGAWQGIFLAEFDGPRARNVFVHVVR
ncbi:MAG: YjbQ family protein [Nitrospirae bacterium]|nr:YjbQ family protein [Nitrospirota bacterium]